MFPQHAHSLTFVFHRSTGKFGFRTEGARTPPCPRAPQKARSSASKTARCSSLPAVPRASQGDCRDEATSSACSRSHADTAFSVFPLPLFTLTGCTAASSGPVRARRARRGAGLSARSARSRKGSFGRSRMTPGRSGDPPAGFGDRFGRPFGDLPLSMLKAALYFRATHTVLSPCNSPLRGPRVRRAGGTASASRTASAVWARSCLPRLRLMEASDRRQRPPHNERKRERRTSLRRRLRRVRGWYRLRSREARVLVGREERAEPAPALVHVLRVLHLFFARAFLLSCFRLSRSSWVCVVTFPCPGCVSVCDLSVLWRERARHGAAYGKGAPVKIIKTGLRCREFVGRETVHGESRLRPRKGFLRHQTN